VRKWGCGCGESLSGPAQKRFVDDAHRQRARRRLRSPRRRRRAADVGLEPAAEQASERVADRHGSTMTRPAGIGSSHQRHIGTYACKHASRAGNLS
jgi:hypothetical protein